MNKKHVVILVAAVVALEIVAFGIHRAVKKKGRSSSPEQRGKTLLSRTWSRSSHNSSPEKGRKEMNSTEKNDVCLTEGCKLTADIILKNMDAKIKPCDDFYAFACGNFIKNAEIREERTRVNLYDIVDDIVNEQKNKILNEPINQNDPRPFILVKQLYATCMDTKKIEEAKLQPAMDLLEQLGGWPVLAGDSWKEDSFNWRDTVYKFRKLGISVDYLFEFNVVIHPKDTTKRVLDIDEPGLGLDREFLIKGMGEERVRYYLENMVNVAELFGADRKIAEKELKKSLEFAMELSHITLSKEERRNVNALYNPMTIAEVQEKFPLEVDGKKFDWLEYVNTLLAPFNRVEKDEVVIMNTPKYFQQLAPILKKTPKRVLANHIIWRALQSKLRVLNQEVRNVLLAYWKKAYGTTKDLPRWEECADTTFSMALGSLYARRYFNKDTKVKVNELVEDIRKEVRNTLKAIDWMDEKTRKNALMKERAMAFYIGYPDELGDDEKLTEFYKEVKTYPGEYFKSDLASGKFSLDYHFKKLREPVNKKDWTMLSAPLTVNAYYLQKLNSIMLPAAILQHMFFSADRPKYINYGSIAYIIGHEAIHAFDDKGCNYDSNGDLKNWWEAETKAQYLKKVKCIIDQYSSYKNEEHNLTLNGLKCQGESVADNGGARVAYRAYKTWADKHKKAEPKLPGLEKYTPRQLFWISVANMECDKYRSAPLRTQIMTGSHPPGEFRTNGIVVNQKEFSEDFQCSSKEKMNPPEKCVVW